MTEIFRHYRPLHFDKARTELKPLKNGGVSFMLRPTDQRTYEFWVHICPLDAEFSAKAAVKRLREAADSVVVPWATITLDDRPIVQQLIEASLTHSSLPTHLGSIVDMISAINHREELKYEAKVFKTNAYLTYCAEKANDKEND